MIEETEEGVKIASNWVVDGDNIEYRYVHVIPKNLIVERKEVKFPDGEV